MCVTIIIHVSGHVDKFNIQSGIHRGELKDERVLNESGHLDIRGICSDALNQVRHVVVRKLSSSPCFMRQFLCKMKGGLQPALKKKKSKI